MSIRELNRELFPIFESNLSGRFFTTESRTDIIEKAIEGGKELLLSNPQIALDLTYSPVSTIGIPIFATLLQGLITLPFNLIENRQGLINSVKRLNPFSRKLI